MGRNAELGPQIVFGQNAHLDIDWQHTFDDYYTMFVGDLLIAARQLLDDQPRAYYSIAEMAYGGGIGAALPVVKRTESRSVVVVAADARLRLCRRLAPQPIP